MKLMAAFLAQVGSKEKFVNYVKDLRVNPMTGGTEFFIRKPTASEETRNVTKAYRILQIHLALGLRTEHTKHIWLDAFGRGFNNLLTEMREKGPRLFFTQVEGDTTMIGAKGGIFWDGVIGYIKRLGAKGFSKLVDKVNALPKNITGLEMVERRLLDVSMEENEFTHKYKWFKRFEDDQFFEGDDGNDLYLFAVNYLRTLGNREEFERRLLPRIRVKLGEKDDFRIRKPTLSEEARNETESYRLMQVHLAMALGKKDLLENWIDCIKRGGYDHLLKELYKHGPKYFIRQDIPEIKVQGAEGGIFWTGMIEYLRHLGEEGFNMLLEKVKALPRDLDDKYKWFKRFEDDQYFEGDEGDHRFLYAVNYLRTVGNKEDFEKLVLTKIRPKRGDKDDTRIRKPTSSEEARNQTDSYRLMQVHLAMALGKKDFLDKWMDCIKKGGYDHLLNELYRLGPKYFVRDDIPEIKVEGAIGGIFWTGMIEYLRYLGQEGFNLLLEKVKALPKNLDGQELCAKKYLDIENTS
ncbi:hypothetical protein WDU94_001752 [Cyamophila willieti]